MKETVKKSSAEVFSAVVSYAVYVLFAVYALAVFWLAFFSTSFHLSDTEGVLYKADHPLLLIAALAIFALLYLLAYKSGFLAKASSPKLFVALAVFAAVLSAVIIIAADNIATADQAYVLKSAEELYAGDYISLEKTPLPGGYLNLYPFQLSFTLIMKALYALFGGAYTAVFKYLNILWLEAVLYAVYRITDILFADKKTVNTVILLLFGFFPMYMYCSFIYPEIITLALCLLSLVSTLRFLQTKHFRCVFAAALCLALGCLLRGTCIIFAIAEGVTVLVSSCRGRFFRRALAALLAAAVTISGSSLAFSSYAEHHYGLDMNGGMPLSAWVSFGMMEGGIGAGWYNATFYRYYLDNNLDSEATGEYAAEQIKVSLQKFAADKKYCRDFYGRKFTSQFNEPTFLCFVMTYAADAERSGLSLSLYTGTLNKIISYFCNIYQTLILAGCLLFVFFFRKKITPELMLPALTVIGGVMFFMLWEAKSRYVLPYFVLLIPYAAAGLNGLAEKISPVLPLGMRRSL